MTEQKYETYTFGIILTVIAFATFTFLAYGMLGWPGFIAGPVIAILAARPGPEDGPWLWEREQNKTEYQL